MKIRHAETEDVKEIRKVAMKSWVDTYRDFISEESIREVVDDWYDTHDLLDQVKDPVFFVAEDEGEIIGFIHASEDTKSHLHRLYLLPEHQGKGLGSRLYKKMIEELKKNGVEEIELEVLAKNSKGLGFYREKGFTEKAEREVELQGEKAQEKVMTKKL